MPSKTPEESKLGHGNQTPKIKLARAFMPVLITSLAWRHHFPIKMKLLSSAQHFSCLWDTQGWVAIMPIIQTALKSNVQNFVALLSASLMKIQSKMKSLSSRQHFHHYVSNRV